MKKTGTALLKCGFAALLVAGVAGFWFAFEHTVSGEQPGPLVVDKSALELGDVWYDRKLTVRVPIRNVTADTIDVTGFNTSCSCTKVDPKSVSIPPGETVTASLTIDLAKNAKFEDVSWPMGVQVVAVGDDGPLQAPWRVYGTVRRAFRFSEPHIAFTGRNCIFRGFTPEPQRVRFRPLVPLKSFSARCSDEAVAVTSHPCEDEPGAYEVQVMPPSGFEIGRYDMDLVVDAETTKGDRIQSVPLLVKAAVVATVQAKPEMVTFGAQNVGRSVSGSVHLLSRNGSRLVVTECRASADDVTVEVESDGKDDSVVYAIRVDVAEPGHQQRQVSFEVSSEDGQREQVTVPVTYHGIGQVSSSTAALSTETAGLSPENSSR